MTRKSLSSFTTPWLEEASVGPESVWAYIIVAIGEGSKGFLKVFKRSTGITYLYPSKSLLGGLGLRSRTWSIRRGESNCHTIGDTIRETVRPWCRATNSPSAGARAIGCVGGTHRAVLAVAAAACAGAGYKELVKAPQTSPNTMYLCGLTIIQFPCPASGSIIRSASCHINITLPFDLHMHATHFTSIRKWIKLNLQ